MMRPHALVLAGIVGTVGVLAAVASPPRAGQADERVPPTTASEAPVGFDGQTNGLVDQAEFERLGAIFEDVEAPEDGLGPVFNGRSCAECHGGPVTGGASHISEVRAGRLTPAGFVEHPGGSLIHDRALDPAVQERVLPGHPLHTFRISLNVLGDGFVEALDGRMLAALAARQPESMRGLVVEVPMLEAPGATRPGRFGWKSQHASLLSFSADAYLNEMGITTPLLPRENSSNGNSVADYDHVADPEDDGDDVEAFATFARATKAPPRDLVVAATAEARAGSAVFDALGCRTCHVRALTTAVPGTLINGGTFRVPEALGSKIIHPFSDFLLHNVGTGDGIDQGGGPATRNRLRTPPLWGLRARTRLMHDGASVSTDDAILRHAGEAFASALAFRQLDPDDRRRLRTFLASL